MIAFIVDDEYGQRQLMCEELEADGWLVEVAEDGIAALGRVRQIQPDLILLDLRMKHFDGVPFLERLRSSLAGRAVGIVIVTVGEVSAEARALADGVLQKPLHAGALRRIARGFAQHRDEQGR